MNGRKNKAQDAFGVNDVIDKFPTVVPGMPGKRKRNVYVYVPDYATEDMRFPVLYMFDGHNVFFDSDATYAKSWGMKEYLEDAQTPMIVVAVECNHGKNYARLKEYSPYSFGRGEDEIKGKGKKYMAWLTGTMMPYINAHYPTLTGREHTWIAGSSMGGLMSLYAVLACNDIFSRAACLSPSLWTAPEQLVDLVKNTDLDPNTMVYMDYGAREMGNHPMTKSCLIKMCTALLEKDVVATCRIVPNGDHCEACWEEQVPFFMNILNYWRD